MKKLFSILSVAFLMVGLVACQKAGTSSVVEDKTPQGSFNITIQSPADLTKAATGDILDSKINCAQVFVFDASGKLETSRYVESYDGSAPISITTKVGSKTVYVVLNSSRLNFTSLAKFETEASLALGDLVDNGATKLVMVGKNTIVVNEYDRNKNPEAAEQSLVVRVKRLAAKVQLDQVKVNFDGTTLEGGELAIQDVYLVNVVGKSPFGVASIGTEADWKTTGIPLALPAASLATMSNWYSLSVLSENAPAVTYDKNLGDNYKCTGDYVKGTAKTMNLAYFAYPNSATAYQTTSEVTTPVHTSLVIKGHLKSGSYSDVAVDKDTYYTFDLPVLQPNMVYKITNIDITMAGADNPGERIVTGKVSGSVVVDEWTDTVELSYEF